MFQSRKPYSQSCDWQNFPLMSCKLKVEPAQTMSFRKQVFDGDKTCHTDYALDARLRHSRIWKLH